MIEYKGVLKWHGRQGRLEIFYDDMDDVWRGFMAVEVEEPPAEAINRAVARPLLLRWDGMSWEPKRAMNNRPMKALEARISRL